MDNMLKLELSSGLFNVLPPCGYWVFDGYLDGLVQMEQEHCDEWAAEYVKVFEHGQLCLDGRYAYRMVERRNLPKDHPEYAGEVEVGLDGNKALDIIARCWVETMEDWIKDRYAEDGRENAVKLRKTGVWFPREYNWSHDEVDFTMELPEAEMRRIVDECLDARKDAFDAYVRENYRSRSGFVSFLPDRAEEYAVLRERRDAGAGYEVTKHLFWACLNFWLFPSSDEEREWKDRLWYEVTEAYEAFFEEAMHYTPVEDVEEEEA
jgi:hypothetical protein